MEDDLPITKRTRSKKLLDITNRDMFKRVTRSRPPLTFDTPKKKRSRNGETESSNGSKAKKDDKSKNDGTADISKKPNDIFEVIKRTLTKEYLNIGRRMQLKNPPNCLINVINCKIRHHKNKDIRFVDYKNIRKLQILIDVNRPILFAHCVKSLILQNLFLNKATIQLMLELVLTINIPHSDTHTTDDVIELNVQTFAEIIEKFPPCWAGTTEIYRQLLVDPINDSKLLKIAFDKNSSLLCNMVLLMENLIKENSEPGTRDSSQDSLNNSEDFHTYYMWEARSNQKDVFDLLNRNDKIDRIFLVLHLLLKLLESDLAMWIMRNAHKPYKVFLFASQMPLIGFVLWNRKSEPHQINFFIQRIFKLFVDCVAIDFPRQKIDILVRFINLIYIALDLCECHKTMDGKLTYPNIGNQNNSFCKALNKIIEENRLYSTDLYVKIIKQLNIPNVKLQLITIFLSKINRKNIVLNPKNIHRQLALLKNNMGCDRSETETINDTNNNTNSKENDKNRKNRNVKQVCVGENSYPVLKATKRKAKSELSNQDFIQMWLIALNAYLNVYHINDIQNDFSHGSTYNAVLLDKLQPKQKPINFSDKYMRRFGEKLIQTHLSNAHQYKICANDEETYDAVLLNAIDITVTGDLVEQYREDIKYSDLIKNFSSYKQFTHLIRNKR